MNEDLTVRITINDQFGLYDENCERVDCILRALGLEPASDWKQGKDLELGILSGAAAIVRMREYKSPIAPEKLKLLLSGAQYIDLKSYRGKIDPSLDWAFTENFMKVADIDIWILSKSLFIFTCWNKISKEEACKKLRIKLEDFMNMGLSVYQDFFNKLPQEIKERIKGIEIEIIKKRFISK